MNEHLKLTSASANLLPKLPSLNLADKGYGYSILCGYDTIDTAIVANGGGFFRRQFCLSRVAALFRYRSPFTVAWTISDIVIDAFKSKTSRFLSHVREKIFEAVQPPFADAYATIAIVFGHRMPVLGATGLHVDPRYVRRIACVSMGPVRTLLFETATRFGVACPHSVFRSDPVFAAIAFEQPSLGSNSGNSDQSAVAMSGDIERCSHE